MKSKKGKDNRVILEDGSPVSDETANFESKEQALDESEDGSSQDYEFIRKIQDGQGYGESIDLVSANGQTYVRKKVLIGYQHTEQEEIDERRFEFKAIQTLTHPFILPIHSQFSGEDDRIWRYHFIISKFVEDKTLDHLLKQKKADN